MTSWTARSTATNKLQQAVSQTAHGFVLGNIVSYLSTGLPNSPWTLAQADTAFNCQGACIVSNVIDADTFVVTQVGRVVNIEDANIIPMTPGETYYVSPTTAGSMQLTEPTDPNVMYFPCFVAESETSGFYFGGFGRDVSENAVELITGDTDLEPNTYYFVDSLVPVTLTLPTDAAFGDWIEIRSVEVGGITVAQNANQTINYIDEDTSIGVGGYVELVATNGILLGGMKLRCYVAPDDWEIDYLTGNWNFV